MNIVVDGLNVTITCTDEELSMLENGLSWFVSECETGGDQPDIVLAKRMMTDIANCDVRP